MKYLIVSLFFLVLVSCKKEKKKEINPIDTYGEKIAGTWTCDSIVMFNPDFDTIVYWTDDTIPYTNEAFTYHTTDTVPKTYTFLKTTTGQNTYTWNNDPIEMDEEKGWIYKLNPLDPPDVYVIIDIDPHKCMLRLNYSPGTAPNVLGQHWYYLSR